MANRLLIRGDPRTPGIGQSRVVLGNGCCEGHAFRSPHAMEGMVDMREIFLDFLTLLSCVLWHHRIRVAK